MLYRIDYLIDRILKSADETEDINILPVSAADEAEELKEEGAEIDNLQPPQGLRDVTAELLMENAFELIENAETMKLGSGKHLETNMIDAGNGIWKIPLPADFMRLRVLHVGGWDEEVTVPFTDHEKGYRLHTSRYAGLRGNPERPAVLLKEGANGKYLEFHHEGEPVITEARYVCFPDAAPERLIDLPPLLVTDIIRKTASQIALLYA